MKRIRMIPENESPAEYRERFMAAVFQGLEDSQAGRILEDWEVTLILDEEFGPLLPDSDSQPK